MKLVTIALLTILILCDCNNNFDTNGKSKIICHISAARGEMLYLITVPPSGEKRQVLDSSVIKNEIDSIVFYVPVSEETRYLIEVKETLNKFYIIPDATTIVLRGDNVTGRYITTGSAASASLQKFKERQAQLQRRFVKWNAQIKQSSIKNTASVEKDSLKKTIADSSAAFKKYAWQYADSTKNPGVFLQVFDAIGFDEDYKAALLFLNKAVQRFPHNKSINQLRQDALETVDIFENEFNLGDSLPAIQLPNVFGEMYNTASLRGKYYLISFWSTWCTECFPYKEKEQQLQTTWGNKVQIVSVAMDDNVPAWKDRIRNDPADVLQLIDTKMWKGTAVRTLKFDSIPFNFLVSPQGRILAKAIPADSLALVIKKAIAQ